MALHSKRDRDNNITYTRPTPNRRATDPLDGSTTGTIGGGGPESGGRADRPAPPDTPPVKLENAASGRLAPDPLVAAVGRDPLLPRPTDVSNAPNNAGANDAGGDTKD